MNTLIGLFIIAVGTFGQSSSYVSINKVKNWSWKSFWLVQGIFAWLVFPLIGALISLPAGHSLREIYSIAGGDIWKSIGFGVLYGIGIAGIATIGYAGSLKSKNIFHETIYSNEVILHYWRTLAKQFRCFFVKKCL